MSILRHKWNVSWKGLDFGSVHKKGLTHRNHAWFPTYERPNGFQTTKNPISEISDPCSRFPIILLMVQKSCTTKDVRNPVDIEINYQPQLVTLPDFFQPSRVSVGQNIWVTDLTQPLRAMKWKFKLYFSYYIWNPQKFKPVSHWMSERLIPKPESKGFPNPSFGYLDPPRVNGKTSRFHGWNLHNDWLKCYESLWFTFQLCHV